MVDYSFLREIDEDIRNERLGRLWSRYGLYVVCFVAFVIVCIIGYKFYDYSQLRRASLAGDAFLTAIALSDDAIEASEKVDEVDSEISDTQSQIDRLRSDSQGSRSRAKSQLRSDRSGRQSISDSLRASGAPYLPALVIQPDSVLSATEDIFDILAESDPTLTQSEEASLDDAERRRLDAVRDEQDSESAALTALLDIESGSSSIYSAMAQLRRASILHERGDSSDALSVYDDLLSRSGVDENFRLIARLRSAFLLVDLGDVSDVESRVVSLMLSDDSPYISLAREALGLSYYKSGDYRRSAELFHEITDDTNAPRGLQGRARTMLELLSSRGILSPQQEALDAEAAEIAAAESEESESDDTATDDTATDDTATDDADTDTSTTDDSDSESSSN